jgi:ABC-type antimicrobial peptide transport system permease subunit
MIKNLKTTFKGIAAQKTRALLTAVATICATAIITCLIAFFHAATDIMSQEVESIRANTKLTVQIAQGEQPHEQISYLDFKNSIEPKFQDHLIATSKRRYTPIQLSKEQRKNNYVEHIMCDHNYFATHRLTSKEGRIFLDIDHAENNFVIIGHEISQMMPKENHLHDDKTSGIFINQKQHEVLGTLNKHDTKSFIGRRNTNRTIFTHMPKYGSESIFIDEITVQVSDQIESLETQAKLHRMFQDIFPHVKYDMHDVSEMAEHIKSYIDKVQLTLTIFGIISTMIASINIINSMYAIIAERLPEIGIRLAIGATTRQIKALLLTETVMLTSLSALIGLALGEALNIYLIESLDMTYTWIPYAAPLSFAGIIGLSIASCYIPLRKINAIHPIKAIQGG